TDLDGHGTPALSETFKALMIRPNQGGPRHQQVPFTRYTRVAVFAKPKTYTVPQPRRRRDRPLRPCLPLNIRPQPISSAASTMPSATLKLETTLPVAVPPAVSARSSTCLMYFCACSLAVFS